MAQVLVSKYADHLPLYRQAQIYARQGVNLDRSTLADWVGRAAFLLRPVHERLLAILKSSTKLFADETTAPVLDPGRGRTKTGQLFAYARDDRPGAGPIRREWPMSMLQTARPSGQSLISPASSASCRSTAMAAIACWPKANAVSLAFCWAHVRRRFYELAAAGPAPIASEALQAHRRALRDRGRHPRPQRR